MFTSCVQDDETRQERMKSHVLESDIGNMAT